MEKENTNLNGDKRNERKNRHLLETAHSLMLNSNVPTHHWGDAVLTACFLINRMSSSLENQISHSIFFHDPLFHVSSRVFGCTCFVHDLFPDLDKLSAKAIKCVFGIFSSSKGLQVLLSNYKTILSVC